MKRILLVDDLGIDVMLTRMALDEHRVPYEIVVARDGEEAYAALAQGGFDLALLDIKMPRVDGFELLERLRGQAPAGLSVIMLSGSGLASDRERAHALGAIDYVQKAVDYTGFKRELRAALQRHHFC